MNLRRWALAAVVAIGSWEVAATPPIVCPDEAPPLMIEEECIPDLPDAPDPERATLLSRVSRYAQLAWEHRLSGLASYYSSFFDGRKTANGEIFRNRKHTAAHLTLPLGTWVEVQSRATGKRLRLRVNDRGPYARKFCLDLSQAAARYLGVDRHPDRYVYVRVLGLPGEQPIPKDFDWEELRLEAMTLAAH